MTFAVNPTALAGLPPFLDRRQADFRFAARYVGAFTHLISSGALNWFCDPHRRVVASVQRYLDDAALHYAGGYAAAVRDSLDGYTHADIRAAARADAALPSWTGQVPVPSDGSTAQPGGPGPSGPEIFDDLASPRTRLLPPADHLGDLPYHPSWTDLLSPSSLIRDEIWWVTGVGAKFGLIDHPVDPFVAIVLPYVGDWAGLARSADVFESVKYFLLDTAAEVTRVGGEVTRVWTGHAADACRFCLRHLVNQLRLGVEHLTYLTTVYRDTASGVRLSAAQMETDVGFLCDLVPDVVADGASFGIAEAALIPGQIYDAVTLIRQAARAAEGIDDAVHHGLRFSDAEAHRLGILAVHGCMPDMTRPFLTPTPDRLGRTGQPAAV